MRKGKEHVRLCSLLTALQGSITTDLNLEGKVKKKIQDSCSHRSTGKFTRQILNPYLPATRTIIASIFDLKEKLVKLLGLTSPWDRPNGPELHRKSSPRATKHARHSLSRQSLSPSPSRCPVGPGRPHTTALRLSFPTTPTPRRAFSPPAKSPPRAARPSSPLHPPPPRPPYGRRVRRRRGRRCRAAEPEVPACGSGPYPSRNATVRATVVWFDFGCGSDFAVGLTDLCAGRKPWRGVRVVVLLLHALFIGAVFLLDPTLQRQIHEAKWYEYDPPPPPPLEISPKCFRRSSCYWFLFELYGVDLLLASGGN